MPTRQQRRAKSRAPIKKKRRGQAVFIAALTAILLGGGAAATLFRSNPQPIKRGAIAGEHWHASYSIEICGKMLEPYPTTEGEIHTHGDGRIHIHPQTPAFSNQNATVGKFFDSVETTIGRTQKGKDFIQFPNAKRYEDGGTCPGSSKRQELVFLLNGKKVDGNPYGVVLHDGDEVIVRFGPEAGDASAPNPLGTPNVQPEGQARRPVQPQQEQPSATSAPGPTPAPRASSTPR